MYYTEFTSASPMFLGWLHAKNIELAGITKGRIKPGLRASSLSYAKADSQKLFGFMYYKPDLPALRRKKTKFVDFIRVDPYASKELLGASGGTVDALA